MLSKYDVTITGLYYGDYGASNINIPSSNFVYTVLKNGIVDIRLEDYIDNTYTRLSIIEYIVSKK